MELNVNTFDYKQYFSAIWMLWKLFYLMASHRYLNQAMNKKIVIAIVMRIAYIPYPQASFEGSRGSTITIIKSPQDTDINQAAWTTAFIDIGAWKKSL